MGRIGKRKRRKAAPRAEAEWKAAAERLGGTYASERGRASVLYQHGPWTLRLESLVVQVGTAPVTVTRCRALVWGRDNLRFTVAPKGKLEGLVAALGFGGVRLQDRRMARAFVARGKEARRIRSVLNDPLVVEQLLAGHRVQLSFKKAGWTDRRRFGPQTRVITVEASGLVDDPDRLVSMARLAAVTLDRLAGLGTVDPAR